MTTVIIIIEITIFITYFIYILSCVIQNDLELKEFRKTNKKLLERIDKMEKELSRKIERTYHT